MTTRRATIVNGNEAVVSRYLPSNYRVVEDLTVDGLYVTIEGEDSAGWTLDDYVLPRLASGLIFAREVPATDAYAKLIKEGAVNRG